MMVNFPCLTVSGTNFLRPTYSYTECQLRLLIGSYPMERTTSSYSSCLFFNFYWPSFYTRTAFQWMLSLALLIDLVGDAVLFTLHQGLRFSYLEPCSISDIIWNPARLWNNDTICYSYGVCVICWFGLTMSPNSLFGSYFVPFVRIV